MLDWDSELFLNILIARALSADEGGCPDVRKAPLVSPEARVLSDVAGGLGEPVLEGGPLSPREIDLLRRGLVLLLWRSICSWTNGVLGAFSKKSTWQRIRARTFHRLEQLVYGIIFAQC